MGINEIMMLNDPAVVYRKLTRKKGFSIPFETTESEFNPYTHKVMNPLYRKKKTVKVSTGKIDQTTGKEIFKEKKIDVCRVAVPVQRAIVNRTTGFIFGIPVEYKLKKDSDSKKEPDKQTKALYDSVIDVFDDNKMRYFDKKLARAVFREREAAELWYYTLDKDGKPKDMKVKLLSPSRGDGLYPHFDSYDRMDGFARTYTTVDEEGVSLKHFDVYTDRLVYKYVGDKGDMKLVGSPKPHGFTKIPIIYYRQEEAEWSQVQPVIERIETVISNWGDTNDYFGSPSYFFKGRMKGFAEKGEQGRVYQGEDEKTEMKVLSWDSSPESVKGELANLFNIAFSYTQTPDISFESMKQLNGNTSGIAIKLMFTDPHMKADDKLELFGEMFTRRCNLVKNGIVTTGREDSKAIPERIEKATKIEPVFTPYMPKNMKEIIEMLVTATGGKAIMSQKEGVANNELLVNPDEDYQQIQAEKQGDDLEDIMVSAKE